MPETPAVKTFYPKTPVEFSSSLLAELDNSTESNYTRQQYAKQYIEREVERRLKQLEADKRLEFRNNVSKSLLKEGDDKGPSVASVNGQLDKVYTKLKTLNKFQPMRTPQLEETEQKVVSCLKSHQGEPLDCWNEVESFKRMVDRL